MSGSATLPWAMPTGSSCSSTEGTAPKMPFASCICTSQDESRIGTACGGNQALILNCALRAAHSPYPRAARAARYASNASRLVFAGV